MGVGLHRAWLEAQQDCGDLDGPALLKTADGDLMPISQDELVDLVQSMKPGDTITVGGIHLTMGQDYQISASSLSNPDAQGNENIAFSGPMATSPSLQKSASRRQLRPKASFGRALQSMWAQKEEEHSL